MAALPGTDVSVGFEPSAQEASSSSGSPLLAAARSSSVFRPLAVSVPSPAPIAALSAALGRGGVFPSAVCCVDVDGKAASHLFEIIFVITSITPWDAIV